jgi:hypothetical protein
MLTLVIQYWVSDINAADEIQSDIGTSIFQALKNNLDLGRLNGIVGKDNGIVVHHSSK